MKKISFFLVLLFILLSPDAILAKTLPQASKTSAKTIGKTSVGTTIGVFPRIRADKRALIVNFTNLQNASLVSYLLTYQTYTQGEGARGSLNLTGSSSKTQELLFGTCSKNVCTYHKGISNMRLEVSYTAKSGKKYIKRYKIKV